MLMVGVVGAPGVGKSTLMKSLSIAAGFGLRFEDPSDYPLVHHVGGRSNEWQFLNQMSFQIRKIESATLRTPADDELVEFDWYASHLFWTTASLDVGIITAEHAASLNALFASAVAAKVPRPDAYLHLVAPETTIAQRVRTRGRAYEQSSVMGQLTRALAAVRLTDVDVPVIELDATADTEALTAIARERLAGVLA